VTVQSKLVEGSGPYLEEYAGALVAERKDARRNLDVGCDICISEASVQKILVEEADDVHHFFTEVNVVRSVGAAAQKCVSAGQCDKRDERDARSDVMNVKPELRGSDDQRAIHVECARIEESAAGGQEKGAQAMVGWVTGSAEREVERIPEDVKKQADEQKRSLDESDEHAGVVRQRMHGDHRLSARVEEVIGSMFRGPTFG
jgi:hypothetical protein